jgi:CubicO group peptidase (beta-lactamase class C family)
MNPLPHSLPTTDPAAVGLSAERLDRLNRVLSSLIERGRLPGAVSLVARRGRIAHCSALGRLDPAGDAPMAADSIFRIYSMTKPIVSVAIMMLLEEGRVLLSDPVAKHLPELGGLKVAVEQAGAAGASTVAYVPARREMTIQDLLRHTSGLTYENSGATAVERLYREAGAPRTNAELVTALGKLPLQHQPGAAWEYGRSSDVLGRLVEVVSGQSLGDFLAERILAPLGMADSGFYVPAGEQHRLAGAFATDPDGSGPITMLDVQRKPSFESAGGGMVSTIGDYARFLQMLLNGGQLGTVRLLGRKTVELMTADHLGTIPGPDRLTGPGYGFGLGFAVRRTAGISAQPGSVGDFHWSGLAGTFFWVDPKEQLYAVLMVQATPQRIELRQLFKSLVYSAIAD